MEREYLEFLNGKHLRAAPSGFEPGAVNERLFPFQTDIVRWACRRGRAALWEDCGLGKTVQQLEWSRLVANHTGGKVLILTPLAVARQTLHESEKFAIDAEVRVCREQAEATAQINITNYERLHLFDASQFAGVVLDESSALKAYTGTTKRMLCEMFARTPYKLACSATPAPNDRKELGNHAEFLGIMPSNEMLARWFFNDTMKAGGYVLRPYAAEDFWRWCASWAVCISKPSDIGHEDSGFDIPPLEIVEHVIEPTQTESGNLFNVGRRVSATSVHREKRAVLAERVSKVAELVASDNEHWAIWCDTDYEADALKAAIPGAVEVRGSHSTEYKEQSAEWFQGVNAEPDKRRILISKPEIFGLGLNLQHACRTTWFAGYSYERWYQSIRRLWRFGQTRPVVCHVIMSANEESIKRTLDAKAAAQDELHNEMSALMRAGMLEEIYKAKVLKRYEAKERLQIPAWLKSNHIGSDEQMCYNERAGGGVVTSTPALHSQPNEEADRASQA